MKLVIDTNCLFVSIPKLSKTRWLFDAIRSGEIEIGITTEILEEYEEIIGGFYTPSLAANVVEMIQNLPNSILVTLYYKWRLIEVDLDDNKFVDCAIACQADYIISHDNHFKVLNSIAFPKVNVIKIEELKMLLFPNPI